MLSSKNRMIAGVRTATEYIPMPLLAIARREGEDAKVTGMTRSLTRRLLALNVTGTLKMPVKSVTMAESAVMIRRIA